MRKVTQNTVSAFLECRAYAEGNTATDGETLYLHGNAIAWRTVGGAIRLSMAGWPTVTTRERLNGLLELAGYPYAGISQRDGEQWAVYKAERAFPVDPGKAYYLSDFASLAAA